MKVRRKLICERVREILAEHPEAINGNGAVNPSLIAERLGISIHFYALEDESLSGFMLVEGGKAIIGVNRKDGDRRQRYTIAHELGHYVLHDRSLPFMDPSTARVQVMPRDKLSSQGTDPREIEANIFAAELLMPEDLVRKAVQGHGGLGIFDDRDDEIKSLADQFEVSVKAMTIRLVRLGYLEDI